jgi:prepilin-type N-terminal cleavage/methylation domain-containing protein
MHSLDPNARPSSSRGFSMVELMIALTVLVIGILAIARLFPLTSRAAVRDRHRTQAAYFAQQKVETLRTLADNHSDLTEGRHPAGTSTEPLRNGVLQRYWTVSKMTYPISNVYRVDVVVRWSDPSGADSVLATSYVNH